MNYGYLTLAKCPKRRRPRRLGARAIGTLIGVSIVLAYWGLFLYSLYRWSTE